MDKIGIIVLNYNNFEDAINCVDSVIKQENVEMEIVLIDNGSTDNSYSYFKEKYHNMSNVTLVKSEVNLGYAKGNNIGIDCLLRKKCKYIFIANSDIVFTTPNILWQLVSASEKGIGLLVPTIRNLDGTIEQRVAYKKKYFFLRMLRSFVRSQLDLLKADNYVFSESQKDIYTKNNYRRKRGVQKNCYIISGSGFLLTSDFLKKYNQLFPETFLYGEEWATMIYLHKANLLVKVVDTDKIIHKGAASTPDSLKRNKVVIKANSARKILKLNFMSSRLISKKYNLKE